MQQSIKLVEQIKTSDNQPKNVPVPTNEPAADQFHPFARVQIKTENNTTDVYQFDKFMEELAAESLMNDTNSYMNIDNELKDDIAAYPKNLNYNIENNKLTEFFPHTETTYPFRQESNTYTNTLPMLNFSLASDQELMELRANKGQNVEMEWNEAEFHQLCKDLDAHKDLLCKSIPQAYSAKGSSEGKSCIHKY